MGSRLLEIERRGGDDVASRDREQTAGVVRQSVACAVARVRIRHRTGRRPTVPAALFSATVVARQQDVGRGVVGRDDREVGVAQGAGEAVQDDGDVAGADHAVAVDVDLQLLSDRRNW